MERRPYEGFQRIKETGRQNYKEQSFRHKNDVKIKNRRFTQQSGSHFRTMGCEKLINNSIRFPLFKQS